MLGISDIEEMSDIGMISLICDRSYRSNISIKKRGVQIGIIKHNQICI